jgi:hypothetical protein
LSEHFLGWRVNKLREKWMKPRIIGLQKMLKIREWQARAEAEKLK